MNRPQTKPKQTAANEPTCWSLEVVRGRVIGHQYALDPGETVVGNALKGARGLDLADQEGSSPRKMAGRHAALTSTTQELTVRDLDSPGGTFVNQQRLLSGQSRRLAAGDVIQLGSVQLRVKQNGVASGDQTAGRSRRRRRRKRRPRWLRHATPSKAAESSRCCGTAAVRRQVPAG